MVEALARFFAQVTGFDQGVHVVDELFGSRVLEGPGPGLDDVLDHIRPIRSRMPNGPIGVFITPIQARSMSSTEATSPPASCMAAERNCHSIVLKT